MTIYRFAVAALVLCATPAAGLAQNPTADAPPESVEVWTTTEIEVTDISRLMRSDRAYAEEILRRVDRTRSQAANLETVLHLEGTRALALASLDREAESRAALERIFASEWPNPDIYVMAWLAAARLSNNHLMLRAIEALSRHVPAAEREGLFEIFTPEMMTSFAHLLREQGLSAERERLAEALLAMEWPGPTGGQTADFFRKILIDSRLRQGRRDEAAEIARQVVSLHVAFPLLALRRHEGLIASPGGEAAVLDRLLANNDRATAAAMREQPENLQILVERIDFLRSVDRNEEAVAVARPYLADVPATVARDPQGLWLVNNAADALMTLGRTDEALALMAQLAALDMNANPEMISSAINYGAMLWQAGRHADALAHAERLTPAAAEHASDYGRMWIASYAVCSATALGTTEAAAARLRELQANPTANQAALNLALLCANDLDSSERLVVQRLQSDEPEEIVMALQDFRFDTQEGAPLETARQRFQEVRARPAVRAALDRVARRLTLPVARTYYGSF